MSSKVLRSFRSVKSLKSEARSSEHAHTTSRPRRPSKFLSEARSSYESSCRYTTSHDRDSSVEFDPLRLHPPAIPPWPPCDHFDERRHPHYHHNTQQRSEQHQELRGPRSVHNMKARNVWAFQEAGGSSLQIYDGFDFGFQPPDHGEITPSGSRLGNSRRQPPHLVRSPSSSGSGSESDDSLSTAGSSTGSSSTDWSTISPATSRPHPAGTDEADYFMKRGDWKRRGIVFASSEPTEVPQEECFDFETPI